MIRKNLTNQITFILPTKKRVIKAANFILKCNKNFKKINPNFLIITSNKIEANFFERKFRNSKNIKIIIQKKSGFMNACFESIAHIQSKFCTFFYDDDKISPHSIKLFQNVLKENIVMGYGLVSDNLYDNKFQSIKINKISKLIIAIPSITEKNNFRLLEKLSPYCTSIETLPRKKYFKDKDVEVRDLEQILLEEILSRKMFSTSLNTLSNFENKVILITGGAGSIGSEISRQLLMANPKKVIVLDQSEFAIYKLNKITKGRKI